MQNLPNQPQLQISPDAPYECRVTKDREDHFGKAALFGLLFWAGTALFFGWLAYVFGLFSPFFRSILGHS